METQALLPHSATKKRQSPVAPKALLTATNYFLAWKGHHPHLLGLVYRTDVRSPAGWEKPQGSLTSSTELVLHENCACPQFLQTCHQWWGGGVGVGGGMGHDDDLQELCGPGLQASLLSRPSCLDGTLHGKVTWGSLQSENWAQTWNSLGGSCHVPTPQKNAHTILDGSADSESCPRTQPYIFRGEAMQYD